jgi:hypothetical protein
MINNILQNVRKLYKNNRLIFVGAGLVLVVLVMFGIIAGANHIQNESKPTKSTATAAGLPDNTSVAGAAVGAGSAVKAANGTNKNSTSSVTSTGTASTTATTTTTVVKTTQNSNGTITKEIVVSKPIAFSTQTQNSPNLKRGAQQVSAGQTGTETIRYSVVYDQNGKEISRKTISDAITKQPVDQITKIGTSDFNLNTDTWEGTESGVTCLPSEYGLGSDGCAGTPSMQSFSAVQISGKFYVFCVNSALSTCIPPTNVWLVNVQPVVAIQGDGTFNYQGTVYRADPRKGGGEPQQLTSSLCSEFGLACGSW